MLFLRSLEGHLAVRAWRQVRPDSEMTLQAPQEEHELPLVDSDNPMCDTNRLKHEGQFMLFLRSLEGHLAVRAWRQVH
jgi:hypothetical protein